MVSQFRGTGFQPVSPIHCGFTGWKPAPLLAAALLLLFQAPLSAQQKKGAQATAEAEYYKLIEIPVPENITLEVGGLEMLPDGKLAVSTRRGDVFLLENAQEDPPKNVRFT